MTFISIKCRIFAVGGYKKSKKFSQIKTICESYTNIISSKPIKMYISFEGSFLVWKKKNKTNKVKKIKRKKSPVTYIARFIDVIMLIIGALFMIKLLTMGMLPKRYVIAFGLVLFLTSILIWATSGKRAVGVIMILLSLVIIGGIIYGLAAVIKFDKTLNKISTDSRLEIVQMSVVVLKDDDAVSIEDIRGYKIGYDESDNASEDMKKELSQIVNGEASFEAYSNVMFLIDALLSKKEQAIILNSAYIEIVSELEGYEDFEDKVKILDTIAVETENTYPAKDDKEVSDKAEKYKLSSDEDTFVMYISGIDTYGDVNTRSRSDVNILAVVNTKKGSVQLINTPRDYYVPLSISNGVRDKLTHAGIYGIDVSKETLEELYGINIDYYLRMNFSSFEKIIDRLGGIDVYSEYAFNVGSYSYKVGNNHLDGKQALAFARERHSFLTGDVQRGKNQMEVIKAMISKLSSKDFLYNYDKVLGELSDSFQTDMSPETIYALVQYQLDNGISWKVDSFTVTGFDAHDTTYSMPGMSVYVMVPDETSVDEAKRLIEEVLK